MAIKLNPDNAQAYSNLGITLFQAKMLEEVIDHFKEVIRIRPDFIDAKENLEIAIDKLGKGP